MIIFQEAISAINKYRLIKLSFRCDFVIKNNLHKHLYLWKEKKEHFSEILKRKKKIIGFFAFRKFLNFSSFKA